MGDILTNHNGIKLDPQLKDVGYLTSSGKKAVGVIGEVMIVDHHGTEVDMADIEVDVTTVGGNTYVGKPSTATGRDFTTAYLAGTTITLSGYPAGVTGFTDEDIEFVRQINSAGVVVATYSRDDTAMSIAANVLTVTGATFGATDTFVIGTNVSRDANLNLASIIDGNNYVGKASTIATRDFTTAYTAATQITLSGYPAGITAFVAEDIEFVRQINNTFSVVSVFHREDSPMTIAGNVLSITNASFAATDTFVVVTNVPRKIIYPIGASGDIIYTNATGDFTATINNGTKTITIAGLPFTLEAINVVSGSIKKIAVTTNVVTDIPLTNVVVAAGVVTLADTDNFVTGDIVLVYLVGPKKGYDLALDLIKTQEQSPLNQQYIEESIVDTTNVATGTYYPAATGMPFGAYKNLSITGKLIDGAGETTTLTWEITNDEDTATTDWVGVYGYNSVLDTTVQSVAATNETKLFAVDFDNFNYRHIRFLITATAATNTVILKCRRQY
jgi:hypothetical protein